MSPRYLALALLAGCGGSLPPDQPVVFADTAGKIEVACPAQTSTTMVALAFGQSNSANSEQVRHSSTRVINYFRGKCYLAQDPLLGATNTEGTVWTLMGDKLLDKDRFTDVILIAAGVGGTSVRQWVEEPWLENAMKQPYSITHFLWHQGEEDMFEHTSQTDYALRLKTVIERTKAQYPASQFWVSIASICKGPPDPEIEAAQQSVIGSGVFQGPNTDLIPNRYDGCHFNGTGQELIASAWAALL